ncbi:hypothetical protein [Candidatus Electronema sp. PJ]|uniref:hypothetical protein n=1 Tax=Candidatus Electronema sp. PJ TaxID=3401572 RepID=UPI003AA8F591
MVKFVETVEDEAESLQPVAVPLKELVDVKTRLGRMRAWSAGSAQAGTGSLP